MGLLDLRFICASKAMFTSVSEAELRAVIARFIIFYRNKAACSTILPVYTTDNAAEPDEPHYKPMGSVRRF